jgi:hypothetical protein
MENSSSARRLGRCCPVPLCDPWKRSFPRCPHSHRLVLSRNESRKNRCRGPRISPPARRCFDGFLPSRPAREQRAKRYFAGWLTEVGNGSTKRKGRIEKQFSLDSIEGFLRRNVSELFSRLAFLLGEEFSVILGIIGKRSERSGSLRCPQERMEFEVKGRRQQPVKPSLECRYSLCLSVSWPVAFLLSWQH